MGRDSETETERVKQIIDNMVSGQESENQLIYDPNTKILKPGDSDGNPGGNITITPEDLILSSKEG